ncbi:GAF domain-containing protein [Tepidiforma thermophila]|uniref:histidine kinase n=1 Tax=Tepidiforma thermophila (strain KCTC 52669 / CGMCC 1.13589 / G233) TaxID=2761530 RepID=A0A2A9HEE6_TEPT2|nr:GAF domain-containing protein [Tepidiforma thermophila]PFG73179.1 signal transduction histidine kinase [Tepidiforma thermophila]
MAPGQSVTPGDRALLQELAVVAAGSGPLSERFPRFAAPLCEATGADLLLLAVTEGDGATARVAGSWPVEHPPALVGRVLPAESLGLELGAALAHGEVLRTGAGEHPAAEALAGLGYGTGWVCTLVDRGEPVGLVLAAFRDGAPDERARALLRAAADLLAAAAAREREMRRAMTAAARARAAAELAAGLSRGDSFETLFTALAGLLPEALPVDYLGLVLRGPGGFALVGETPAGVHRGLPPTAEGNAFIEQLAAQGDVLQFRPEAGASPDDGLALAGYGRAAIGVIREGAATAGLLIVARQSRRRFDDEELAFLGLLRSLLSQALTGQLQQRRAMEAASRARVLNELAVHLSVGTPLAVVFRELTRLLPEALTFDWVALAAVDPAGAALEVVGAEPEGMLRAGMAFPLQMAPPPPVAFGADGMYEYDPAKAVTEFGKAVGRAGYRRGLVARLFDEGRLVGSLNLARREAAPFSAEEREFVGALARLLAVAVGNRRRLFEATRLAERTRILNELALLLNQGEGPEAFFAALAHRLQAVLDFDGLGLWVASGPEHFRAVDSLRRRTVQPGDVARRESFGTLFERLTERTVVEAPIEDFGGPIAARSQAAGVQRVAAVALRHEGRDEGLLLLSRMSERPYDAEELAHLETVGALLGQALANHRKVQERLGEAVRRQALSEITALLEGGSDVREHFDTLAQTLLQAVGFDLLSITYRDPATGAYLPIRSHRLDIDDDPEFREESIPETAEAGGIIQYRTERNPRRVPQALHRAGYRRAATAVMTSAEGPEGLLTIGRREDEQFTDEELEFIRLVAALLGQAVANRRGAEARRREEEEQRVVAAAAAAVAKERDPRKLAAALVEAVRGFIPEPEVRIAFLRGGELEVVRERGDELRVPVGPNVGRAIAEGVPAVFGPEDPAVSEVARREMAESGIVSRIAAPARAGGETVGMLLLFSKAPAFRPGAREARLAQLIADFLGPAMANMLALERERQEAEDQAIVAAAAAAVAREDDALAITHALTEAARRFVPAPFVTFGFLEGETAVFLNRAGPPTTVPLGANFREALDQGVAVVPAAAGRASQAGALPELQALGIQAHIIAAATSAGTPVGLLVVGSRDPAFSPGERETRLVRLIADIAGPAMANARAAERARLEAEDQRLLAEIAAVAARESTPDAITVALQRPLRSLVPLPIIAFGFREGERLVFPLGDGTVFESEIDAYAQLAEAEGQTYANSLPDDIDPRSPLWRMGAKAASTTVARAGGRTLGFLVVASRDQEYRFGERELRLLRLIAQIVGPAMENARAAQRAREDAEEQRFLAEAARIAAAAADERELVRGLGRHFRTLVPASRFDLLVRREDGDLESVAVPGLLFPFDANLARTSSEGQVVASPADPRESEESRRRMQELGIVTYVSTRLAAGGREIGTFWIGSGDPDYRPTERHLRIFRMAADLAGPALASLLELRRRQEEAEEQRFLADAAAAAARATTDVQFLAGLEELFGRAVPQARIGFFYLDGEELVNPVDGSRWTAGPALRRAISAGQSVDTVDTSDALPENRARIAAAGLRRWVTTAAASEGEFIGVLVVGTGDAAYQFSERDLRRCRLVADIAGPAMANFRERRRRLEEAEDERVVASVAAAAAAARTIAEVVNCLPAALGARVPGAYAMYGFVEGDSIAYQVTDPEGLRVIGQEELVMQFSPVGRAALATGQGVGDLAPYRDRFYGELGLCAYALTAYHAAGGIPGMLMVASRDPSFRFGPRELALLRRVTGIVGPVIETVRAQAERDRQAEEERILAEASAAAATAQGPTAILRAVLPALERFVPQPFAAFGRFDGDVLAWPHLLGGELRLPVLPHEAEARRTGQAVVPGEALPASHFGPNFGFSTVSYTASYSGGAATGLLLVASRLPGHRFSERDLALIRRIAQVVGPAVEASIATQERERQAAIYGLILRSLSEAVILSDASGRTVFANALGREIVRAIDPEGRATTLEEAAAMLPEDLREAFRAAVEEGKGSRGRTSLTIGGETRWFDYEYVPLADPQLRVLTVAADVTEEVRREEEEERKRERMEQASRLAALGELIGGVAHELNNPLTAILGFAEVLALSDTTGQMGEELGIIQKEALRARNIVRDLLFIARPGTVEHGPVGLAEVVGHVQRLRERAWQAAGIDVQVALAEELTAWGNEHQLTQVLINLVTNAEHALEGRATRRIVIEGGRDERGNIRIAVSDTGAGMDEATRARIFEPFFTTKQGFGTGLGLSLSYSIIQSHGGTIDCISAPGVGTTFVITLPAPPGDAGRGDETGAPAPGRQATVLVIDDEPSLRKVCRRLVESLGHRCLEAEKSARALELAAQADPDIVLCDYRLATETADAVFAGFEAQLPHLIPRTILATGATTDAGVAALIERYGVELLPKPYGIEDISRILRERLGEDGTEAPTQAGSSG